MESHTCLISKQLLFGVVSTKHINILIDAREQQKKVLMDEITGRRVGRRKVILLNDDFWKDPRLVDLIPFWLRLYPLQVGEVAVSPDEWMDASYDSLVIFQLLLLFANRVQVVLPILFKFCLEIQYLASQYLRLSEFNKSYYDYCFLSL